MSRLFPKKKEDVIIEVDKTIYDLPPLGVSDIKIKDAEFYKTQRGDTIITIRFVCTDDKKQRLYKVSIPVIQEAGSVFSQLVIATFEGKITKLKAEDLKGVTLEVEIAENGNYRNIVKINALLDYDEEGNEEIQEDNERENNNEESIIKVSSRRNHKNRYFQED